MEKQQWGMDAFEQNPGMLRQGSIPMTSKEIEACKNLVVKHGDANVLSITRRDPGETGPVLAHVGDDTYLVESDGRTRKQKAAR